MDALMHRLEWTTLLFFASMFVTLECLERLRLIHWFSEQTINLISTSDNESVQLVFAIIILMWVSQLNREIFLCFFFLISKNIHNLISTLIDWFLHSGLQLSGLLSSLIDSIPVTAMMIKIVILIAEDKSIKLPIQPLVWAVAFGPCLGGKS